MPDLVEPTVDLHPAWLAAHDEWGAGLHEDGFGLSEDDDVRTAEGFLTWVRLLEADGVLRPDGTGATTYWWIVEGDEVLGGIALRHGGPPERTLVVGSVGYGVRPSARGRGLATWALGEVLGRAASYGLDRLVVVCRDDNLASARVAEHHAGVLVEVRETPSGAVRRYEVPLPGS